MSLAFCPTLDDLCRTGRALDADGVEREAHGLSTRNNIQILRGLMMALKPKRTIEVGLAAGGSALTFAASHRDLGSEPGGQHTAIDPYQPAWHHLGKTLIARAGLNDFVKVVEEPSCLALPALMRTSKDCFDLAYVDGSHAFHEALLDFYYMRHLLREGGVVVLDDCRSPGVKRLLKFIRKDCVSFTEFDLFRFHQSNRATYSIAHAMGRLQCIAFRKVSDPEDDESWQWK